MGLLFRGVSRLARVQAVNESETVLVTRRDYDSAYIYQNLSVLAVIAGPGFSQNTATELPGRIGDWSVDFVIRVADWVTAGCVGVPQEGDEITRTITIGGTPTTATFRVIAAGNIPAWDWGEPERITYRIHTRYEALQ